MLKIVVMFFSIICTTYSQNAWINEINYDDDGVDVGEFIEIVVDNSLVSNIAKFTITLYNGSATQLKPYDNESGDNFTPGSVDLVNGFSIFTWFVSGIQNGAPDGLTLEYDGTVLQFLSYEGTFTPLEGLAAGMSSIDIGVSETGTAPDGGSIGLTGSGNNYSDFTWTTFSDDSPGSNNGNQVLPVELTTFTISILDNNVELNWETATEVNNYGFEIERKFDGAKWNNIGFVEGHGNSNSPKYYSYSDNEINASGKYLYRLKQVDIDGSFEYSNEVEASIANSNEFELNQNYPNPFNPTTSIKFNIPIDSNVKLNVFNILGEEVAELLNKNLSAGHYNIQFNASKLNSGIYFYKLETNKFTQMRKMILVK